MQRDRDELLAFVRWGRLPPAPPGQRRRRRRLRPVREPRRLAGDPALPPPTGGQLEIHEYLELEFHVGETSRR